MLLTGPTAATLLSWLIGRQMKPAQALWNGKIEDRLSVLHDLLSNIKSLRMTGFSGTLADTVRKRLITEVDASNKYRFYLALVFAIGTTLSLSIKAFTNIF